MNASPTKADRHKRKVAKRHPHKWFEIILITVLAIQCVRELMFAWSQSASAVKTRSLVLAALYGFVSFGVWRIYRSKEA